MKLLFLSEENLRDRQFIRELVHNFGTKERAILLHDHFGNLSDTRFVTKRISALFSEAMVVNNAFSGDQRQLIKFEKEGIQVKEAFIRQLFEHIQLLILNPIALKQGDSMAANALEVVAALKLAIKPEETILFTQNSLSPLVQAKKIISGQADHAKLLEVYEEERPTLTRALTLAPASIASPVNFFS